MTAMPANVASTLTVATDANQMATAAKAAGKGSSTRRVSSVSDTGVTSLGASPPAVADFKSHLDGITKKQPPSNSPEAGPSAKKRSRSVKQVKLSSSSASTGNPGPAGPPAEASAANTAIPSLGATVASDNASPPSPTSPSPAATPAVAAAAKTVDAAAAAKGPHVGMAVATTAQRPDLAAAAAQGPASGPGRPNSLVAAEPQAPGSSSRATSSSVAGALSLPPGRPTSPPPVPSGGPSESSTTAAGQLLRGPTSTPGSVQGGGGPNGNAGSALDRTVRAVAPQTGSAAPAQGPAHIQSSSGSASAGSASGEMGPTAVALTSVQAHPVTVTAPTSSSTQSSQAPTPAPSQSQQMLSILSPVLNRPNGTHQISIEMHPADLGTIQATVTVQSGHVTVELNADHPGARQALGTALPDLRQQLGSGGRHADVFLGGATRGGTSGNHSHLELSAQAGISANSLLVTSQGVSSRTSVDLRL